MPGKKRDGLQEKMAVFLGALVVAAILLVVWKVNHMGAPVAPPSIRVEGVLYQIMSRQFTPPEELEGCERLGIIGSSVGRSEFPKEELQSNRAEEVGAEVYRLDGETVFTERKDGTECWYERER